FGALALSLAIIGVYGVTSYAVARRTPEFGIRLALGAPRQAVFRLVIGQAIGLLVPGLALGVAGGIVLGRFVSDMFFGVSPGDPVVLFGVSVLLWTVGLPPASLPGRRAIRVDPPTALRYE